MKPKKNRNLIKYILISLSATFLIFSFFLFLIVKNELTRYPTSINPSEEFCLEGYFPFPQLYTINLPIQANIEIRDKTTLFNKIDVFAKQICIKPTALLSENKEYTLDLGYLNLFQKDITVRTQQYPEIKDFNPAINIPNDSTLRYELKYPNDMLEYHLLLGEKDILCTKESIYILCNTQALGLEYGKTYLLRLTATYENSLIKELGSVSVTVLSAVEVEQTSIKNKAVIQNISIPKITITLNKDVLQDIQVTIEDSNKNLIKSSHSLSGKNITVTPGENFKQNTRYFLKLNNLVGTDGSKQEKEYVLEFSIDDGPKIISSNITPGFLTTGNIVLTFNQNIKVQNVKNFVKINDKTEYSYSISKNKITINPTSNLSGCRNYSVAINKGLVGSTGLVSSKSSTYTLKTQCKRVVRIGTSVQGRGIYATYFGNGSKKIVFFASMHGSEANTKTTLNRLIYELENYSYRIPTSKTIIVIPTINPDGIANKKRFNAHGVDLNRNFDSSTWVSGTYFQTNYYPLGGGATPFSEPESVAIRNLVYRENPYLTISYHSAAGYVIPTNTARGIELGHIYSQLSGYRYTPPGTEGAFSYDITGTFEEWAGEHGYSGLVIELSSAYVDQFTQNRNAMWKMIEN